jgi:CHAT domain-containing protein/Tfp pilus assembly protein PilF
VRQILLFLMVALPLTMMIPTSARPQEIQVSHTAALDSIYSLLHTSKTLSDEEHFDSATAIAQRAYDIMRKMPSMPDSVTAGIYNGLGLCHYYKRNFDSCETLWTQALAIRESISGPPDSLLVEIITNMGRLRFSQRQLEESESYIKRAKAIREELYGPDHPEVAESVASLAAVTAALGRHDEAESFYLQALRIRREALGEDHLDFAKSLRDLAVYYDEMGRYNEADSLHGEELKIRERLLGKDHVDVAESINSIAAIAYKTGRYTKADSLHKRALNILRKSLGDDHPSVAQTLCSIANIHLSLGEYREAETLYKHVLGLMEKIYGAESQKYERILANLAAIYNRTAEYAKAESLYIRIIEIAEKLQGPEGPDVAFAQAGLAAIYTEQGRYSLAEPLFIQSTRGFERQFGFHHPYVASNLYNLAFIYESLGRFYEAESALKQSLAISKEILGPEHPDIGQDLNFLASLCAAMGKNDEAIKLNEEALAIREKALGNNHPDVAQSLSSMGNLIGGQGKYAEAEELHRRAWAIREKSLGLENRFTAQSIGNVASTYYRQGKYSEAEPLYEQALEILKKVLGPGHPDIATTLDGLAICYAAQGKFDKAEPLHTRALAMREKIFGPRHPNTALNMMDMAQLYAGMGDYSQSLDYYRRFLTLRQQFINYVFSFSSEEQKLRWIREYPLITGSLLSLALEYDDGQAKNLAMEMILKAKAVVIDAVMAEKQAAFCSYDKDVVDKLGKRAEVCSIIAGMLLSESLSASARDSLQRLYGLQDSLESELSRLCSPFKDELLSRQFHVEEIAAALPDSAVLWELLKYQPYDFGKVGNITAQAAPERYLAFVLDHSGKISTADLGDAEEIDSLIRTARKIIYESNARVYSPTAADYERQLGEITGALYDFLFAPLANQPEGQKYIFVSPDGMLNLLPFEILADHNGAYVIENHRLSYLSSGRDLLRFKKQSEQGGEAVVLADPDFDYKDQHSQTITEKPKPPGSDNVSLTLFEPLRGSIDCLNNEFTPLRYGRGEADAVIKALKHYGNLKVHEYYGDNAGEEVLKHLSTPPRILHLVTHGFFCEPPEGGEEDIFSNPLLRSGLALAGANSAILGTHELNPDEEDGILTAFELSDLNLVGTELVTLSACEAGVGEASAGEGVFGLQRAFRHAGAEATLMSLWKIPDKETAKLMEGFYKRWLTGMSKRDALRKAALDVLYKCRGERGHGHPLLWGGFILTGNP